MKPTTLCFPLNDKGEILLGMKKRGFGQGKYNGFGGKIKEGESFRQCAIREMREEVSLIANLDDLDLIAFVEFRFPYEPALTHICYVYVIKEYTGIPLESEEMAPAWFKLHEIPYDAMWEGDKVWLPKLLSGDKLVGYVTFDKDNSSVLEMKFKKVTSLTEEEHIKEHY